MTAEFVPLADGPMFSIVTVTFRNVAGLRATGRSVTGQTSGDYEWIVIDGGSTDGTVEYLNEQRQDRLSFVSESDGGIFDAMRKGLERCRGRFVVFMNAGDCFAGPDTLAMLAEATGDRTPALVYGDSIESDGISYFDKPARRPTDNALVMFTHHQAQFYRVDLARRIGFDLSYRLSADWVLTTRVLAAAPGDVLYVPKALCIFERGGASQQAGHRKIMNRELFRIYREEQGHGPLKARLLWLRKVTINGVRARFPRTYDRLRYRGSAPVGQTSEATSEA